MIKRDNVTILGRTIGTSSGWDGEPGEAIWFYEFEPKEGLDLPECDLLFDAIKGIIGALNSEDGTFIKGQGQDVVLFLYDVPRDAKA